MPENRVFGQAGGVGMRVGLEMEIWLDNILVN